MLRKFIVTVPVCALIASTFVQPLLAQQEPNLQTVEQQAAYAIGLSIGQNLKENGAQVDVRLIAFGIQHALNGQKPLLTDEQAGQAMQEFQRLTMERLGDANAIKGQEFLAQNKTKPDVQTLPSGLQVKVLKSGDGPTPTREHQVQAHYRGTFIDGEEFDSSYGRGEPSTFPVTGVIAGWTEALLRMKVGDKWQLFVPSELAYGAQGRPGIPPHATLIFEVELVAIEEEALPKE